MKKEIAQEYFIETKLHDKEGRVCPLPLEGRFMAEGLRKNWLKKKLPAGFTPRFCIGPVKLKDGREGYSLRAEIISKSSS